MDQGLDRQRPRPLVACGVLIAVHLASFTLDARDGRAVALFVDADGRCLPLWMDDADAAALASAQAVARGVAPLATTEAPGLTLAAVGVCGGAVGGARLRGAVGGVLRASVSIHGLHGEVELPARASAACALAIAAGAPVTVEDGLLAQVHAQLLEAAARAASGREVAVDESVQQTPSERWSQLLQHLAEKLV